MSRLPLTEPSSVVRPLSPIPSIDPLDLDVDLDLELGLDLNRDTPAVNQDGSSRGSGLSHGHHAQDNRVPAELMPSEGSIAPAHDADDDRLDHDHQLDDEHVDRLEQEWPSTPSPPPPMPSSLLVVKRPLAFPTLTSGAGGENSSVVPGESSLSMSISSIHSHGQPIAVVVSPPLRPVHVIPVSASIHSHSAPTMDNVPPTPTPRSPAPPSSTASSPSPIRTSALIASKKPSLSSRTSRPRPRSTSIPSTPTPLSPTLSAATSTTTSRKPKPTATLLHQRQRRGSTSTLASGTTSLYSTSTANVPQYAGAPTRPGGVVHHSIKRVSAAYEPDGMGPVPKFPDQDMARLVVRHANAHAPPSAAVSDVGDSVSMIHGPLPARHNGGSASISIRTHASDSQSAPMFPMSSVPATGGGHGHGHMCLWELGVCCHEWTDPNPSVRRTPRVCGMRFNSGDALYKHLTEHHIETGGDAARCGHCHWRGCVKVFRNTSKYLRRDHFKKHITELVEYVCLDCGRVCDKEYGSGRHICREGAPPRVPAAASKADASTSASFAASSEVRRIGSEDELPRGMPSSLAKPASSKPIAVHVSNTTEHHHHHAHRHEHEGDLHVHFDSPPPVSAAVKDAVDDADSATKASSSVEEWVRNDALAAIRHHQLKQQQQRSPLGMSDTEDEPPVPSAGPVKLTLATLPMGISPAEFLAHHVDPALVSELERMITSTSVAPARNTSEWGIQTSPIPPPTPTSPAPTSGDPLAHYAELATVILSQLTTLHAQADAQAEAIQHLIDAQVPLRAVPATLVDVVQALSAVAGAHQGVATRLAKVEEGVSAAGSVVGSSRRESEDRELAQVGNAAAESFRFAPTPTHETDEESVDGVGDEDKDDSAYASAAAAPAVPAVTDIAHETAAVLEPKLALLFDSHAHEVAASHAELAARLEMLESAATRREQETAALVEQVPATIMAAVARQLAAMEARLASMFAVTRALGTGAEKRDVATSMTPPASPKMRGLDQASQVENSPPASLLSELIHQESASSLVGPTGGRPASTLSSQPPTSPATEASAAASDILSFFTSTRSRTLERYEPKKVVVPITLATPGSPTFSTAFSLSSSTNVAGAAGAGAGSSTNVSSAAVPDVAMPTSPTRAVPADTVSAPVRHRHPAWNAQPSELAAAAPPKPSPVAPAVVAVATEPASTSSSPRSKSLKRLSIIPTPPPSSSPTLTRPLPTATGSSTGHLPTPQSSNSVASTPSPTLGPTTSLSTTSVQSAPPAPLRRPLTLGYSPLIQVDIPKSTSTAISPPSPSVSPTRSMIAIPTHHADDHAYATLRSVQSVTVGTMTRAKKKRGVGRLWQAMTKVLGGGGKKKMDADRASLSSGGAGTASGRYVGASTSARRV